jgi:AcrR family transcriptional regulator
MVVPKMVKQELKKFEKFTEKGRETIAEICKVAARVFDERGYLAATLGGVAQAAGMTKGGIFHYFSKKEELLFLILYRYIDASLRSLKNKLEVCRAPYDSIYVFIHHHLQNYEENPAESRLALRERANLPSTYLAIIKDMERDYREILRSLVESLMEGKKNSRKVMLATYALLGMVTLPYVWFDPDGEAKSEELGDLIYEIYLGGLGCPESLKGSRGRRNLRGKRTGIPLIPSVGGFGKAS